MKNIITAVLVLAITLTLAACEEKKKQDGTTTTASETEELTAAAPPAREMAEKITAASAKTEFVCGKGGGGVKLLECIIYDDGRVLKFEYNSQNRIIKKGDETITYADNLITVGTEKFTIKGNKVTFDNKRYTIDKDGYIVNYEEGGERDGHIVWGEGYSAKCAYKDGNQISFSGEGRTDYSYDDKKSPFSGCTTPKWLIQHLTQYDLASKNNVSSYKGTDEGQKISAHYKYEYDSDGFPVTAKMTNNYGNTTTTRYTYYGEPQTATAEKASGGTLTDTRDSKTYKTVKIGNQTWMAENLNYNANGSKCYDNCPNGRMYNWETAMKICPSGWHLPSKEEWETLKDAGHSVSSANGEPGEKLKPVFGHRGESWWSATGSDNWAEIYDLQDNICDDVYCYGGSTNKDNDFFVRCIQN